MKRRALELGFAARATSECDRISRAEEDRIRLAAGMEAVGIAHRMGKEDYGRELTSFFDRGLALATTVHVEEGTAFCDNLSDRDVSRLRSIAPRVGTSP